MILIDYCCIVVVHKHKKANTEQSTALLVYNMTDSLLKSVCIRYKKQCYNQKGHRLPADRVVVVVFMYNLKVNMSETHKHTHTHTHTRTHTLAYSKY